MLKPPHTALQTQNNLKSHGHPTWHPYPVSTWSRQGPHVTQQRQHSNSHAISPERRRAPSNGTRADIWIIALPIHAAWSMAPSQWISKMCRLFFADEYARRTAGLPTAAQVPDLEPAFKAAQNILPNLEARIIEFLSEWLVTFLMPAKPTSTSCSPKNTGLESCVIKKFWSHRSVEG